MRQEQNCQKLMAESRQEKSGNYMAVGPLVCREEMISTLCPTPQGSLTTNHTMVVSMSSLEALIEKIQQFKMKMGIQTQQFCFRDYLWDKLEASQEIKGSQQLAWHFTPSPTPLDLNISPNPQKALQQIEHRGHPWQVSAERRLQVSVRRGQRHPMLGTDVSNSSANPPSWWHLCEHMFKKGQNTALAM